VSRRLTTACIVAATAASIVAQSATVEIGVADGARTYPVARVLDGRLAPTVPCIAADAPLDPLAQQSVVASQPAAALRAIAVDSEEWRQLAPPILALAERREREQRLTRATLARAPRFLDWLFANDADGRATYYFEASRRLPSVAAPLDTDVDTDPPGTIRVVVSGFVRRDPAGLTPLGTKGELRWEQDGLPRGPNRPDLRPLGVLALAADAVWVMESRTPATSWVHLFAVGTRGAELRVTTRIGGC
jgi:hypothetical protein